jgi:hypothetical protein
MIDQLLSRLYLKQSTEIDKFYNNISRCPNEKCGNCNYSWETDSTGFFLHGCSSVSYFRFTDGKIFRLLDFWHPDDFKLLGHLYSLSKDTGKFRIDQPITSDVIIQNNNRYFYTETQRPNKEIGSPWIEDVGHVSTEKFGKQFIDSTAIILPYIHNFNKDYHLGTQQGSLEIFHHMAKDSAGYFWKDIRIFRHPIDDVLFETIQKFILGIVAFQTLSKESPEVVNRIIDYAKEKWHGLGLKNNRTDGIQYNSR